MTAAELRVSTLHRIGAAARASGWCVVGPVLVVSAVGSATADGVWLWMRLVIGVLVCWAVLTIGDVTRANVGLALGLDVAGDPRRRVRRASGAALYVYLAASLSRLSPSSPLVNLFDWSFLMAGAFLAAMVLLLWEVFAVLELDRLPRGPVSPPPYANGPTAPPRPWRGGGAAGP